jgi:hypothetical protein
MFLIAFISFITRLNAQTVSDNFANTMNDVFAGVDLNRVPHHLLTDYAMEFVDIRSYNGVNTANNYVHKGIYTSAYNTLLMARTKTNVADLIHPNQFESNWKAARIPYTIALSGLYYKYSRIRENAHPNAITVSNNKLYDKYTNGIWQNPYETDDVFMMTAPIFKYNYKNMNVVLPTNLWYSNQDAKVQSIAVNFNDGNGYQTITMGQNTYVSYSNEGTYTWDYKLTLTNGQILHSHSKLIVGNQTAPINNNIYKRLPSEPCSIGTLVNGFDQVEFEGTQQFGGFANSATIQIRYASGNPCDNITNPLIVAEGFESGLLGNENPLGDNDITNFRDNARTVSIDLRNEIDNFDIIYINWDNGRDDIRRNALLLEDIITWINSIKTTTNQNVVLGQSMGGLIARYALVDMEQDSSQDHDTRLYISHDAPHQGANIPISIQFLARHLADEFVSTPVGDFDLPAAGGGTVTISDINNVFNSIGTRQLLANNINASFSLDNNAFSTFQVDLQSKGYPQQTRNVAISNGSHCANDQEIQALQELLYLSGDIEPTILLDTIINYFPFLSFLEGLSYVGLAIILEDPAYLAGLLPGRTNLNARFEAKSLPNVGQSANIYRGRIRITKKINFILFTLTYNINVTDRNYNNPSGVQLPLDSYPGGAFNVPFDLSEINSSTNNWLINLNVIGRSADSFNFIPTTTALDVGSGSATLNNNDYKRVYTAANPPTGNRIIPFDNFTSSYNTNGTNERHISFNTRNGDWLATELDNIVGNEDVFNCAFACGNAINISGVNQFCTGTRTFSVPAGADTYQWQFFSDPIPMNDDPLTGNVVITSATNTNTLTINHTGNRSGWYNLRVVINSNRCDVQNLVLTKRVYIGAPTVSSTTVADDPSGAHLSANTTINSCEVPLRLNFEPTDYDYTEIEWEKITTDIQWSRDFMNYPGRYVYLYPECNKEFKFRVRAKNNCGFWSPWRELTYNITECWTTCQAPSGNIVSDNFILYPVPANTILNFGVQPNNTWNFPSSSPFVNLNDLNTDPTIDGSGNITYPRVRLLISFYNSMGNLVYSTTIQGLPNQMDVSSLPTGNYIMTIEYLGQIETHNIQIN